MACGVILYCSNRIYREGLSQILSIRQAFDGVYACNDQASLQARVASGRPPVVILVDISSAANDAAKADCITTARRVSGGRPVVALGLDGADTEILASFEAGASAYVTKEESIEDLVRVSLAAADGQFLCPPRISRLMQERLSELAASRERNAGLDRLSRREHIILGFLGDNLSNKQIARELGLEVSTIKNHVHNIIVKLSVKNRVQAASFCRAI
ncbi:two-component system nitrate/nitrite response regulator NarL [Bradyrhizobium sp. AZCC 2262]